MNRRKTDEEIRERIEQVKQEIKNSMVPIKTDRGTEMMATPVTIGHDRELVTLWWVLGE